MLGIKKLQSLVDSLITNSITIDQFEGSYEDIKKEFESLYVHLKKLDHMLLDLKSSHGASNVKLSNLFDKVTPYSQTVDTLIVYARQVDDLAIRVNTNTNALDDLQKSINHMLENQRKIMDFMEFQDRINQDLIAVVEAYAPVKKVPKLPKKKAATTERL